MRNKYYPGPYMVYVDSLTINSALDLGQKICDISRLDTHEQEIATAYLLGAAPEMYEALLAVMTRPLNEAHSLIKNALIKASGR